MCIALISTSHPSYSLIVLDNRDEYLSRPTAPAQWWPEPKSHVLGGRDLLRSSQGTWMGVTKHGRIAILTNYREPVTANVQGLKSRGAMVNAWLEQSSDSSESTKDFVEELVTSQLASQVGGFSLVCGKLGEPLAIVSNRMTSTEHIDWVASSPNQTVGLSNTFYGDRTWPKVLNGEKHLIDALRQSQESEESEEDLIRRLFGVLSIDTLPRRPARDGEGLETYIDELRKSVFIPTLGRPPQSREQSAKPGQPADAIAAASQPTKVTVVAPGEAAPTTPDFMQGSYGTMQQTIVLVDHNKRVRFVERTLYEGPEVQPVSLGKGDRDFTFSIED